MAYARVGRPRRGVILTAGVMSLVVLVATGVLWGLSGYAMGKVDRVAAFQGRRERPSWSSGINVLLVGSDRRTGLSEHQRKRLHVGRSAGRRSDTMILAHISTSGNGAILVSLPRDWYVTIPQHRSDDGEHVPARREKLNAAFADGGPDLTVATVENNTGVDVDHYVEASFLGFVQVVNALGGVSVCVPRAVDDPASGLRLPAGTSHLGGVQSLKYVRARKTLGTGSDLERIDRQQKFLASMIDRALSTGTLLNPFKFTRFLNASLAAVSVDKELSSGDLRRLTMAVRDLDPSRVTFVTVPIADPGVYTQSGELVARADERQASRLFDRVRADEPIGRPRQSPDGPGAASSSGTSDPGAAKPGTAGASHDGSASSAAGSPC